ncbi:hypothetical protein OJ997_23450 [Solirubrobacter phytolaccae]|uniref:Ribonucleotide reductase large subunit C-terminal domain-containing protein n=1 Tax=Solirubrobacter phytolaccae TaxID=1404360 RepID=A0A9X3SHN0_9ACTN|nr:hypothetical protein [Solirubrobacter phytolaccae]MDA0183287.1 hypothetical protein [Solirubrobacter phytolaccae]
MRVHSPASLERFTVGTETFEAMSARVACALGGSERPELQDALLSGRVVPAGQLWRGAGIDDAVLYNCFVTDRRAAEDHVDLARRITRWTAYGAGVGVALDDATEQEGQLTAAVDALGASQQTLWEAGVSRTATMVCVGSDVAEAGTIARRLTRPELRHLNMAVRVSDAFVRQSVEHPRGDAADALLRLAEAMWSTGNPGLTFEDRIRVDHPFDEELRACNPCGEQHLAPDEGCNLASINLATHVVDGRLDLAGVEEATELAVRMLDRAVDQSAFPSARAQERAHERRRIGIGILGLATAMNAVGVSYSSSAAAHLADEIGRVLRRAAERASAALARTHGAFPGWSPELGVPFRRHAYLLSIPPTGGVSRLWGVSPGVEAIDPLVPWERQVAIVAALQRHVDGGISKTVLLPQRSTVGDVVAVLHAAWSQGLKGISVFRLGSRPSPTS